MIRLLFVSLLFLTTLLSYDTDTLFIDDENEAVVNEQMQKVLYLSYKEIPKRLIKGEIFSVTIKTLSTVKDFKDVEYQLSNYKGIEPLNYELPFRDEDSKYYYETFYFLAKDSDARLPDFTATLIDNIGNDYRKTTLEGEKLNIITLNPKKNFSNIIATSFELIQFKTTTFDQKHNIVIFVAQAENCDITALNLNNTYKQGIESVQESIFNSKVTYYAVIDKKIENLSFSYFNLDENRFIKINIPIMVTDDSVTTQSDLKPKDQSKERLKMAIAAIVSVTLFIFIIFRKKYIYLFLLIFPLAYILYIALPTKEICIKEGANIHLLPVKNGTIFETTNKKTYLQKEGKIKGFIKVKLKNEKIGWVRDEDICKY